MSVTGAMTLYVRGKRLAPCVCGGRACRVRYSKAVTGTDVCRGFLYTARLPSCSPTEMDVCRTTLLYRVFAGRFYSQVGLSCPRPLCNLALERCLFSLLSKTFKILVLKHIYILQMSIVYICFYIKLGLH